MIILIIKAKIIIVITVVRMTIAMQMIATR